jgi:hypothetical protein
MTNALRVNNFSFSYKKSIESIHNVQELISNTIWQVQITVPCNMFSLAFGDFDRKKGGTVVPAARKYSQYDLSRTKYASSHGSILYYSMNQRNKLNGYWSIDRVHSTKCGTHVLHNGYWSLGP